MSDAISEYQRWKQQGQGLRANAKQAIEQRFRDLLTEAMHLSEEYKSDFGKSLSPPPAITAFRYKVGAKRPATKKAAAPSKPEPKPAPVKLDPKIAALTKKLAGAKAKLEAAKAAGTPTKNLEDKVYELEDDLRLAQSA
jgi:hypothetical protein